ncbi:protein phosphatase inhibitor 2 [Onthophagus taurus]|uniref:protein phosphatase inhibitor 2 n=1 Tax=Onthophagus taurus TaxID=166361 RepID=UPI0039BE6746
MQKPSEEKKILKDSKSNTQGAKSTSKRALAKHAKFDESNIKETYHPPGKDYGHMKINEPKTPYNKNDGEFMDPTEVAKKLMEGGKAKALMKREQDDKAEEEIQKRKDFESKRKQHYDEFKRAKLAADDDDDDDEKPGSSKK